MKGAGKISSVKMAVAEHLCSMFVSEPNKGRERHCLLMCLNMNGISLKGHRIMVGPSGDRRLLSVKPGYAVAICIICVYDFSRVKI